MEKEARKKNDRKKTREIITGACNRNIAIETKRKIEDSKY